MILKASTMAKSGKRQRRENERVNPIVMKIQEFIREHLKKRLEKYSSLVIYDPDTHYQDIVGELAGGKCALIEVAKSVIKGREKAMDVWRKLGEKPDPDRCLLIYIPTKKPMTDLEKQNDPFQIFALGGGEFPKDDGDEYQALCHKAAPDLIAQIDELFKSGTPNFDTINSLIEGKANWPQLRTLLKAESAVEILIGFLSPNLDQKTSLEQNTSWLAELKAFSESVLGYKLRTRSQKWDKIRDELWRFVLYSEFVLDLPGEMPSAFKDVPYADLPHKNVVYTLCDNIRSFDRTQQMYMDKAIEVAEELQLAERLKDITDFGERDTFAFEEVTFLRRFAEAALQADLDKAGRLMETRKKSIWVKQTADRLLLWTIAERALELIKGAEDLSDSLDRESSRLPDLIHFYCERMKKLDLLHRNLEQAVLEAYGELEPLEELVETARKKYLNLAEAAQRAFVDGVEKKGWPVSGFLRNTEVFDHFVAPLLKERQRVAFFMVDALRYELGAELESEMAGEYKTEIHGVCAQLPTITTVGMAALMPEADGNLVLRNVEGSLVPQIKGTSITQPNERYEFMNSVYGDRCFMINLSDLLSIKKKPKWSDAVDLLIIKTTDIDDFGEMKPIETFRMLPDIIKKILAGLKRLSVYGFQRAVIATDHGFILLNEQAPGDTVTKPPGDWVAVKNRCLLGNGSSNAGTLVVESAQVGIKGDFPNYAVPRTFGTFVKGKTYFHEGLSLPECILPVISVRMEKAQAKKKPAIEIRLSYKGGKTSQITTGVR